MVMHEEGISEARERVLQVAERLFMERGYASVTLRDIADGLQMRPASLYNHAPGGKEELFIAVVERAMARHRAGIDRAVGDAEPNIRAQLRAAARWLISQPEMDLARMLRSDALALHGDQSRRLEQLAYESLFMPLQRVIDASYRRGEIRHVASGLMAGLFLTMINALHSAHHYSGVPLEALADDTIDVLLEGAYRR
jgi:AcrR family transcriptional regulator